MCMFNSTLMDMVAQDKERKSDLQVDIAMEIQGQDLFKTPSPIKFIGE